MTSMQETDIPNFERMSANTKEIMLIIPHYIGQMALSQKRLHELAPDFSAPALAFTDAREGEQFLFNYLRLELTKLVWSVLMEIPEQEYFHPAITIERRENGDPIEMRIQADLSAWVPILIHAVSAEQIELLAEAGK